MIPDQGTTVMQSRQQFREHIVASTDIDAAMGVLASNLSGIGVDRFIAGFVHGSPRRVDGSWRRYDYRAFNFPKGWDAEWKDFNRNCPYYHACLSGTIAFDWKQVRDRRDLSENEIRASQYLADQGLLQGYTVPVHTPRDFGFVTVIGHSEDRQWGIKLERQSDKLIFLTHAFHESIRERFADIIVSDDGCLLSKRELECLRWAAAGKTTEDVARILGISPETVRIYFKRAMDKFGATNRIQAVAAAYEMGLLSRVI